MAKENPTKERIKTKGYMIYQEPIHRRTSSYIKKTNKPQNHFGTPPDSLAFFKKHL